MYYFILKMALVSLLYVKAILFYIPGECLCNQTCDDVSYHRISLQLLFDVALISFVCDLR